MATSGTYSFNLNKQQIITRAFQIINVGGLSDTIESADYLFASDILNMMLKVWEADDGIRLWKRKQATLFPVFEQTSYQLGSVSGADHCTNTYVSTTTTADVASGVSAISVDSTTGLSATMYIGLEQDDGTRVWGTISSIVNSLVTCSFTTTDTVASGSTVVAYTSKINRPLSVIRGTVYDLENDNTETTLNLLGYDEYYDLPSKSLTGSRPNQYYYDKVLSNSLPYTGTFYLYPTPNDVNMLINFTYMDSIQDMLNTTDTADLPQEWLYPITFNLAVELAYAYGKYTEIQILQPKALELKAALTNFDSDDADLNISFDSSFNNYN